MDTGSHDLSCLQAEQSCCPGKHGPSCSLPFNNLYQNFILCDFWVILVCYECESPADAAQDLPRSDDREGARKVVMQRILEEGRELQSGPVTAGRKEETGVKAYRRTRWSEVQRKEESERKQFQLLPVM